MSSVDELTETLEFKRDPDLLKLFFFRSYDGTFTQIARL